MEKSSMPNDDPRIKRVLKCYLKGGEFPEASLELTGIGLAELSSMCRCSADNFKSPRELDGYGLVYFSNRLGRSLDASKYDYIVHSYVKREFCSPDRVPPKELDLPCEDGPPAKIPLEKGFHWVSSRPNDGLESFVGAEDEI